VVDESTDIEEDGCEKLRSVPFGGAPIPTGSDPVPEEDFTKTASKFLLCFIGLQVSYLTWGYMQELIMTTVFRPTESSPTGKVSIFSFYIYNQNRSLIFAIL